MLTHLTVLVVLILMNYKEIFSEAKKINWKIWVLFLVVLLFGFYLRNSAYWLGPHTDGYVAQESAEMWILNGFFSKSCGLGSPTDCLYFEKVLAPPGFPTLIAIAHLFFGIDSINASVISAVLSSLTILLVFFISFLIFRKAEIGLYASLVFALIPQNIINSQSGLSRPTGLFFVGLAIVFYLLAIKNNKFITWLATIASVSYAIYVRQETFVIVPFLLIFFIIFKWETVKDVYKKRKNLTNYKIVIFLVTGFFISLQIPFLEWILNNNSFGSYNTNLPLGLDMRGVLIQGRAMLSQLFNYSQIFHFQILATFIFIFGFVKLIIKKKKSSFFILTLFFIYFLVYSLFYDGAIIGSGILTRDYRRRTLMLHLPYSIISGYGFYIFYKLFKSKHIVYFFTIVFIFLILSSAFTVGSKAIVNFRNIYFYFPKHIFKDISDNQEYYPSNTMFNILEKLPVNSYIIAREYLVPNKKYFKDKNFKVASIDLINESRLEMFLNEFKKNGNPILIDYGNCERDYSIFLCSTFDSIEKEFLFSQNELNVYRLLF